MRITTQLTALLLTTFLSAAVWGQPKVDSKLKKPKEFEERQLGSEKMANKKFTLPRHFFQNMYTHYNYYFNANNKLNEIVNAAKLQHREDYSRLLPFYNYSFDVTSQSSEIDSIIEKCTAGILLHDLRNDWIDNLYLIMGRAYMLRKNFDSAAMTFQFINYTYSPKDKDGDEQVIGSNRSEGTNALSIATKEKRNVVQKVFTRPPSRNDAFVWMIRNYSEAEQFIDAESMITTLKNDPNFPPRLKEELAEVEAFSYYKQQIYDSSANYLVKAVSQAANRTEKARWYYLIGQMYQLSNHNDLAAEYFAKCVNTATDPVMEVYARLSSIRLRKASDPKVIQENIDEIVKMAKKEKYEPYRDIIYYAAALVEMERDGYAMAETYLKKSVQYNTDNTDQRSLSFLALSDMLYGNKEYGRSGFYYDSVSTGAMDSVIAGRVTFRKPPTKSIYDDDRIIFAQDSLQKIAAMPETERIAYLKALAKRLRKEKGLKEEVDLTNTGQAVNPFDIGKGPSNLFDADASKEFYFYNPQQRANGFTQFKQRWGARPNVDNWRRSAAVQQNFAAQQAGALSTLTSAADNQASAAAGKVGSSGTFDISKVYNPEDISYDALSANLPTSTDQVSASNKSINEAMFSKGKALQNKIEDLPEAIKVYEALLARLSENDMAQEVMFNLIYCYNKTGQTAKADALKRRLNSEFKDGEFTKRANNPALGTEKGNPAATAAYKKIYDEFVEGNFEKAVADKRGADSVYGNNYWNPQLLYIEAVYYVKERQDSAAINRLNVLAATYPTSPLADKAKVMVDVLSRRKEIEDRLTKLNITRLTDDTTIAPPPTPAIIVASNSNEPLKHLNQDSMRLAREAALKKIKDEERRQDSLNQLASNKLKQDSIKNAAAQLAAANKLRQDSIKNAATAKLAAQKAARDSIAAATALANKLRADSLQKATAAKLAAAKTAKDSALIAQAAARQARADSLKEATAARLAAAKTKADLLKEANIAKLAAIKAARDSARDAQALLAKFKKDSIAAELAYRKQRTQDSVAAVLAARRLADSLRIVEANRPKPIEGFLVNPTEPQTVMILLDKVDAIYLNECVNAFNRYHQRIGGQYSAAKIKINTEYSIVQVNSPEFVNADAAYAYISKVRPKAASEIVPWLDANKFSFYIISNANLELLKEKQNVAGYLKALKQTMPNKF